VKLLRTVVAALTATVVFPASVWAQAVETGASIGLSCQGTEGNFCGETARNLITAGPFFGIWLTDDLEVNARIVWMRQPAAVSSILQADVLWHCRPGARIRPFLGGGAGRYSERVDTNVAAIRASFVTGVSISLHPRIRLRAGWRHHNVGLVDEPLSEVFGGLAYRFGTATDGNSFRQD